MFLMQRTMIEPGVRYLPLAPPLASHITLEAAVDLTKKSEDWRPPRSPDPIEAEDADDSDSDAPLDMSVTATTRLTPVFPGFSRELSPARSDRSEVHVRHAGLFSPSQHPPREWSTERSEADKDEFPKDGCHICGMPKYEMAAHDHVEGACNQRPITCSLCSKTFSLWSHYESHKKCHQKLKQRQYPCQSCGKIFTSASNRNMHQRIHKGVRPFHCVPCGVYFRQKAHLQKHQRTQGHIQASELFNKKRTDGSSHELEQTKKEDLEGSETRSEDSVPHSSTSSMVEDDHSPIMATDLTKSSPKRKQSHPQQQVRHHMDDYEERVEGDEPEAHSDFVRENLISSIIEFNTATHGYDCRQCEFSSPDHAVIREHVALDHLQESSEFQCKECMITFTKPFNLLIHNRKHETASQFLPCEYCEQVFKVPNKLIKHMEGIHSVCPTCGLKNNDKASLLDHQERVHNEVRRGIHLNIQHLTSLSTLMPLKHRVDTDSRHAKMRKVDTLAEHIRAKQLRSTNGTNVINGNEEGEQQRQPVTLGLSKFCKLDLTNTHRASDVHHGSGYTKPGLEGLVTQLNKISNADMMNSQNNNVVSSFAKLPDMDSRLNHNYPRYSSQPPPPPLKRDHQELTPPCSPPVSDPHITSHITLINNNHQVMPRHDIDPEDDCNENGLDLTLKKEPKEKEPEVNIADRGPPPLLAPPPPLPPPPESEEEVYNNRPIIATSFPYIVPNLPFLTRMPINALAPQPNPSLTEHLFKLAAISRPIAVPTTPQDLTTKQVPAPTDPNHHNVLSAMLGQRPPPVVPNSVFPVFNGALPASMFPQHPLPKRSEEVQSTQPTKPASTGKGLESKPFRCSYCPKEFGHLSSLESHVERLHTNESKHHCEICRRAFSSKSNLTAHKKIHTGERPFECPICKKRFRQKAHLQKHETTHSSATPYQCPHCDKAFGHPSNLNTHISTHSDVRPYECTDCGKAYKDAASFKRHRMVHTGERPHSCSLCMESFIDSKSLKRHREAQHPSEAMEADEEDHRDGHDDGEDAEEEEIDDDEELIEPGREDQFMVRSQLQMEERGSDEGIDAYGKSDDNDEDDFEGEGDLEIAEVSADSGVNSSLEQGNHLDKSL